VQKKGGVHAALPQAAFCAASRRLLVYLIACIMGPHGSGIKLWARISDRRIQYSTLVHWRNSGLNLRAGATLAGGNLSCHQRNLFSASGALISHIKSRLLFPAPGARKENRHTGKADKVK
jgi:hypothetical protein